MKILISVNIVFVIGVIYRNLINMNLPYSIDVSLISILFLGLGYLFKRYFEKIKVYFKLKYIIVYLNANQELNFKKILKIIYMFNKEIDCYITKILLNTNINAVNLPQT